MLRLKSRVKANSSIMLKSLKAVEKKRAYKDVVAQIRALIENGYLKQGDQLPTERDLGEMFNVSRSTIREAIRSMESLKLIKSPKGEGAYVLSSSEEDLVHTLATELIKENDSIYDIFYVRRIIEPHVGELAAEKATAGEIEKLGTLLASQVEAVAKGESIAKYDIRFHAILAEMSKNPVLVRLLAAFSDLLEETRSEYLQYEERSHASISGHNAVFSAVKNRNGAAARLAMCAHLEEMETIVLGKKRNMCDKD